jgi:hypothetical protein
MPRLALGCSLFLVAVACASGARQGTVSDAPNRVTWARPATSGEPACVVEPLGRGCRVFPFLGPCATYLSANEAERQELQQSQYLNLRFPGDHRPFLRSPPVVPSAAHHWFVVPGGSESALVILLELLGAPKSLAPDWGSEEVFTRAGHSDEYAGSTVRLTPDALHRLAAVSDLHSLSAQWDRASRAFSPTINYRENATEDCFDLLSSIVEMARDAERTSRAVYVVGSLARYEPRCAELGGCNGYGCDDPTGYIGKPRVCHSERDECLGSPDCGSPLSCRYEPTLTRWTCHKGPPPEQSP